MVVGWVVVVVVVVVVGAVVVVVRAVVVVVRAVVVVVAGGGAVIDTGVPTVALVVGRGPLTRGEVAPAVVGGGAAEVDGAEVVTVGFTTVASTVGDTAVVRTVSATGGAPSGDRPMLANTSNPSASASTRAAATSALRWSST